MPLQEPDIANLYPLHPDSGLMGLAARLALNASSRALARRA
jgi:hypothetical protein